MTEKRFTSEYDRCGYYTEIIDEQKELDLSLPNPKKNLTIEELVNLLNELNDEDERLKQRIKELELLNDGLKYALQNIRKIDVEIDVGDKE